MIYIIDGCDCSGKSTIANMIIQAIEDKTGKKPLLKKGSSFEIAELGGVEMFNHMFSLLKLAEVTDNDIIVDRFYFSNLVYANMYGYPSMNDNQFTLLKDYLNNLIDNDMATVFIVESSLEKTKERMLNRGDEYIKIEDIKRIKDEYEYVLSEKYTINKIVKIRT